MLNDFVTLLIDTKLPRRLIVLLQYVLDILFTCVHVCALAWRVREPERVGTRVWTRSKTRHARKRIIEVLPRSTTNRKQTW